VDWFEISKLTYVKFHSDLQSLKLPEINDIVVNDARLVVPLFLSHESILIDHLY